MLHRKRMRHVLSDPEIEIEYVSDTCILLHEIEVVKRLTRDLLYGHRKGRIVIPYAAREELERMYNGLKAKKKKCGLRITAERDERVLFKQAKRAQHFVEKKALRKQKKGKQVWIERSKGEGIVKELLADVDLFNGAKQDPSIIDIRILATAIRLQGDVVKSDANRKVYLVTRDRRLKLAARNYGVPILGTLYWLWEDTWEKRNKAISKTKQRQLAGK